MFNIKENSICPSSLINFAAPPPSGAATQQPVNTNTSQFTNKIAAGLKSGQFGQLQGSSIFSAEVAQWLLDNESEGCYIVFTLDKDEPVKRRGSARLVSSVPSDANAFALASMPQELQNSIREHTGKTQFLPCNEDLVKDAQANDYKTGSRLYYQLRAIKNDETGRITPFMSYYGKA